MCTWPGQGSVTAAHSAGIPRDLLLARHLGGGDAVLRIESHHHSPSPKSGDRQQTRSNSWGVTRWQESGAQLGRRRQGPRPPGCTQGRGEHFCAAGRLCSQVQLSLGCGRRHLGKCAAGGRKGQRRPSALPTRWSRERGQGGRESGR